MDMALTAVWAAERAALHASVTLPMSAVSPPLDDGPAISLESKPVDGSVRYPLPGRRGGVARFDSETAALTGLVSPEVLLDA